MNKDFELELFNAHKAAKEVPTPDVITEWLDKLLELLFPQLSKLHFSDPKVFKQYCSNIGLELYSILKTIDKKICCDPELTQKNIFVKIPALRQQLYHDAQAIFEGDPAAQSITEVIHTYPGFYAMAVHRIAKLFIENEIPLIPRMMSEYAHSKTGIDIHPGATIGKRFCIDHGTGIVIGETTHIGDDVKIYQGVTLGALSVKKELACTKRHPTIEDGCVIYAGATILGGDTVIGANTIIGGNVWITQSVPPNSMIYYDASKATKHYGKTKI